MYCTPGAIVAIDLFGSAGYPGRLVQLAHHQIAEIYYDGDWHYLDTDLFGNGETIVKNGNIPSVAEMSKDDYQELDALPAYQESNVMDCTGPADNHGVVYPSYNYFSSQAYLTDVPQNYYVGLDSPFDFEHGWKAVDKITPGDIVVLNDSPEQETPTRPIITYVSFDPNHTTLTVSSQPPIRMATWRGIEYSSLTIRAIGTITSSMVTNLPGFIGPMRAVGNRICMGIFLNFHPTI